MIESLEEIREYIQNCSEEYLTAHSPHPLEAEWKIDGHTILSAISRASDLTRRGMRGIIAEAVFENEVLSKIVATGWKPEVIEGDPPYDAQLRKSDKIARIQVKLQRLEAGAPKLYKSKVKTEDSLYVVEVQRTRNGRRIVSQAETAGGATTASVQTRPYRFGEFDILAVNMHPSSGTWNDFRYCLASKLIPRKNDANLIEIMQPVADEPNDVWTDSLPQCLNRLEEESAAKGDSE